MPRTKCTTRIHELGLAPEVTELLQGGARPSMIAKYLRLRHGVQNIDRFEVAYFRDNYAKREQLSDGGVGLSAEHRDGADLIAWHYRAIKVQTQRVRRLLTLEDRLGPMQIYVVEGNRGKAPQQVLTGYIPQVRHELRVMNNLLTGMARLLAQIGMLRPQREERAEVSAEPTNPAGEMDVLAVEQFMIRGGMRPEDARLVLLRAGYGPERFGDARPVHMEESPSSRAQRGCDEDGSDDGGADGGNGDVEDR